jgi:branched-chain amino acid transport system permease protein
MLVSVGMLFALYALITKTRIGLIIQAALSKPEMVEALGHDVPRIFMWVFGGGVALAALAGVIGGNAFVTEPGMAAAVGSIVFVIVVVGGMGSLTGAFIASLLIGFIQTIFVALSVTFSDIFNAIGLTVDPLSGFGKLTLTEFAPVLPYLLMVGILIFRPRGIMGVRES